MRTLHDILYGDTDRTDKFPPCRRLALGPEASGTGIATCGWRKEFWGNVAEGKLFSPEFAVQKMLEVVETRTIEDRGKCWDWKGEEVLP